MFFGYPIESTAENWLHECLCEMVRTVHMRLDAGQQAPEWPSIIPENYREKLKGRPGLRNRFQKYSSVAASYSAKSRQRALKCLTDQNQIDLLVSCCSECDSIGDLPKRFHNPAAELFGFAFDLLKDLNIRDTHYKKIHRAITHHVCPFCGCEYFDAPGGAREDLDHYLPKSRYPFAAANLRNLVPMGMKCNERYKLDKDILRDASGTRRRSFDPYGEQKIQITLDGSVPFVGADGQTPAWKIEFDPDSPECETWDDMFQVRERIKRDVLDPSFNRWLHDFAAWFKQRRGLGNLGDDRVKEGMLEYAEDLAVTGLTAREFLRAPLFRMLHRHCSQGDQRLLLFMRDLLEEAVPQPAVLRHGSYCCGAHPKMREEYAN